MFKKILKKIGQGFLWLLVVCLALVILLLAYFNFPIKKSSDKVALGVTFSSRYAQDIKVNWQDNFLALLDDLGVKKIRIPVYWDLVEKNPGKYDFSELDWQIKEAAKRQAEIVLVIGQKVPRWPECAIPNWAQNDDQIRKSRLLKFIDVAVKRYKNEPVVKFWQVENEPFLNFGICPPLDVQLLDSEIGLVRLLDPARKIIVTDSGELSLWIGAAKRADIFGTTMYRTIWKKGIGYFDYPIGPRFFHFKKWLANLFTGQENFIVIELQAEPWISGFTTEKPLAEQFQSMDADKLKGNVDFAQKVGFPEVYLWGVEWWYWLKVEKDHPELWNQAKELWAQ
jgi:hypothetical protein